ncbi:hypothetical protein Q8791_18070 [Nocardiopsis sp. CT-R113]|uniref:Uncharacterized protein n=1 Tax=Nocardiopsis codii TaxID=3065942 RepID=A0ABU7KA54_9ACTN|nr:hypothetical protein [Nocardiopsis sp. CT-R113]MEE2039124.1 hypothetical protein [Nocardiopsis sp. CT-R113]
MRRGRLKGPLGSPERPASALGFRLVLAVFGVLVMLVGLVLAFAWNAEAWLVVLLGAGLVGTCVNVYWVSRRLRYERPRR